METRKVVVQIREFDPGADEITFVPRLTGSDGEVLLERAYVCTTDAAGAGEVDLPVKASGTIRYDWRVVNPAGGETTGRFELEAGEDIDLADLIAGSPEATESVRDYVDEKVAAAVPYKVYRAVMAQTGTDAPTVTVLENTFGTVTPARYIAGQYGLESAEEFTENTFVSIGPGYLNDDPPKAAPRIISAWRYSSALVAIASIDLSGNAAEMQCNGVAVEILVY